jgi:hypothetical protein
VRRPAVHVQWVTRPSGDSPTVIVLYTGTSRRCTNMCARLERAGFRVFCGDKYNRSPEGLSFFPNAFLIRVDNRRVRGAIRPELHIVTPLRRAAPDTPILLFFVQPPTAEERELMQELKVAFALQARGGQVSLAKSLYDLMG